LIVVKLVRGRTLQLKMKGIDDILLGGSLIEEEEEEEICMK
jgi:hypothetical protein